MSVECVSMRKTHIRTSQRIQGPPYHSIFIRKVHLRLGAQSSFSREEYFFLVTVSLIHFSSPYIKFITFYTCFKIYAQVSYVGGLTRRNQNNPQCLARMILLFVGLWLWEYVVINKWDLCENGNKYASHQVIFSDKGPVRPKQWELHTISINPLDLVEHFRSESADIQMSCLESRVCAPRDSAMTVRWISLY